MIYGETRNSSASRRYMVPTYLGKGDCFEFYNIDDRQLLKDFEDELEGGNAGNKPLFEDV